MSKPIISIVVPVYKVEDVLDRCVRSLINQTYSDIEIILVDDGSPDNCPAMCDEYARKDSRIKVIHKENGGLSDARNAGLLKATGEYILFVDSDDYIELNTCERFVQAVSRHKPELVVGNAIRIENHHNKEMRHSLNTHGDTISGKEFLKHELKKGTMYMAAWMNLYKRDFLIQNKLFFKVGLLHEDEQFTPRVFLRAGQVVGTDITFYYYVIREGSITKNKNIVKNAEHIFQTCKELDAIYDTVDDKQLKKLLKDSLVKKYLNMFQVAGLHKKEYSHLIDKEFLKGKAFTLRNKCKVMLFCMTKTGYYFTNKCIKSLKNILARSCF